MPIVFSHCINPFPYILFSETSFREQLAPGTKTSGDDEQPDEFSDDFFTICKKSSDQTYRQKKKEFR